MDIKELAEQIFTIVLPYTEKIDSPVAYINVSIFPGLVDANSLWTEFNTKRWDTILSSAELLIKEQEGLKSKEVKINSLSLFEDGDNSKKTVLINKSIVL